MDDKADEKNSSKRKENYDVQKTSVVLLTCGSRLSPKNANVYEPQCVASDIQTCIDWTQSFACMATVKLVQIAAVVRSHLRL
jgi:hypothetical protein